MVTLRSFIHLLLMGLSIACVSCKGKTGEVQQSQSIARISDNSAPDKKMPDQNPDQKLTDTGGKADSDPAKELAMQEAALNGDASTVKNLIAEGVNVNAADEENRTALMFASFNGHIEIVKILLESDAVLSLRDASGRTALLYASTGPFPETVKLLLEHNADPNITDAVESFTPLMHAAAEGQLEVAKVLLAYGADASMKDVDGDTAYNFALANGHAEVAELLKAQ